MWWRIFVCIQFLGLVLLQNFGNRIVRWFSCCWISAGYRRFAVVDRFLWTAIEWKSKNSRIVCLWRWAHFRTRQGMRSLWLLYLDNIKISKCLNVFVVLCWTYFFACEPICTPLHGKSHRTVKLKNMIKLQSFKWANDTVSKSLKWFLRISLLLNHKSWKEIY